MDAGRYLRILTQAALMPLPTKTGVCTLMDADHDELEYIRGSRGRESSLVLARRALKILADLDELEKDMKTKGPKNDASKKMPPPFQRYEYR